jgi:hypothetical protein
MASRYSTKVTASGGRHGSIRSEDGSLDLRLALPRALDERGDATNPERLFTDRQLVSIAVEKGSHVHAGEVLATLSAIELTAQADQARAALCRTPRPGRRRKSPKTHW